MLYVMFAGGDSAGSSSAESALPWVLIEDGTNKQLSAEERSVSQRICASVYQLQYALYWGSSPSRLFPSK